MEESERDNSFSDSEIILNNWIDKEFGPEHFSGQIDICKKFILPYNQIIKNQKVKVVTIAGTNGKGTTAYALSRLLQSKNIKNCLWSSPHILSVTERFQIDGNSILADELLEILQYLKGEEGAIVGLGEDPIGFNMLSYYEYLFLAFLYWSLVRIQEVKVLILEVGLGGRLDAVNVINPDISCITSISRDHQEILGRTYKKILFEKMGIIRSNKITITSLELKYLRNIVKRRVVVDGNWIDLFDQQILNTSTNFNIRNYNVAATICELLDKGEYIGSFDLVKVNWRRVGDLAKELESLNKSKAFRGRGEIKEYCGREFTFYGTHNLDGLRKLKNGININHFDKILVSFSKRDLLDVINCLICLNCFDILQSKIYLTNFDHSKSLDGCSFKKIEKVACSLGFKVNYSFEKIIRDNTEKDEAILITGSYYFIGEVQKFLSKVSNF